MTSKPKPQPYRRFARFWLRGDYDNAVEESAERRKAKRTSPGAYQPDALTAAIEDGYTNAAFRDDVEEVVLKERGESLPLTGVELRDQYTIYGHFLMLARLIGHAPKIRCYMDQDSGFRAAFMAAFSVQIRARRADGWYVQVLKETTIDEKDAAVARAKKRFAMVKAANAGMGDHEIQVIMALEEMTRMESAGKWNDRWLVHPWPNQGRTGQAALLAHRY